MKRGWFVFLCIFFVSMGFVCGEDALYDDLNVLVNSWSDSKVVYGEFADTLDILGAARIVQLLFPLEEGMENNYFVVESDVKSFENRNLILVGGPCANSISEKITDEEGYNCEDWKFSEGQSIIKSFENGDGVVIMVAGTTKEDTSKMCDVIGRYTYLEKLKISSEVVFEVNLGECGNSVCDVKETIQNCPSDCFDDMSERLTPEGLFAYNGPEISGDYVVFHGHEEWGSEALFVDASLTNNYLINIDTKEVKKIGKGTPPRIDGDYVVYVESGYNQEGKICYKLVLYQISTDEKFYIVEDKKAVAYNSPIISKNNVIYERVTSVYNNDTRVLEKRIAELMRYDIETGLTEKLFDFRKDMDRGFEIDGNNIVYKGPSEDYEGESWDLKSSEFEVWIYNILTDKKVMITNDEYSQRIVRVWDNFVVWADERMDSDGNSQLYIYDITTKETKPLKPHILNNDFFFSDYKIGWSDQRNSNVNFSYNSDVFIYDIENDVETRLTFDSEIQGGVVFDGNYAVWLDRRNKMDAPGSRNDELYFSKIL